MNTAAQCRSGLSVTDCPRCLELLREERAARARGDYSAETDCRVLRKRHPHRAGAGAVRGAEGGR
ncbi:hypothetical protein [Streptomyces sp. NPDC088923]|uniref:hypothetical protein n=1 Tax=Streptomyces sp. NPDC088923 TaxID=3365913 RepID=UPI0038131CC8